MSRVPVHTTCTHSCQAALLVYGVFGIYFVYWAWDNVDWRLRGALVVGHLFVTLWMMVLVRAVSWTTMAGAIAGWCVAPAVHTLCAHPLWNPMMHTPLPTPLCPHPSMHTAPCNSLRVGTCLNREEEAASAAPPPLGICALTPSL